jgi:hypothetical protein
VAEEEALSAAHVCDPCGSRKRAEQTEQFTELIKKSPPHWSDHQPGRGVSLGGVLAFQGRPARSGCQSLFWRFSERRGQSTRTGSAQA